MYQRSGDIGLGVPFNIASYALLTLMLAHVTGLNPGEFILQIGDAHIYKNHVDALRVQIARKPYEFPMIEIRKQFVVSRENVDGIVKTLEEFEWKDFSLLEYTCHPALQMDMAV